MTLEEILDKLKEACLSGKVAIRLHSGDPSLYGAIREQVEGLLRLGIESDVCPGVSSLFAAASALNAEYTVPGVTQTLVVTRTGGRTPVPETESLKLLAKLNASLAVFLSSSLMEKTASLLMEGGLSPDTPAAIVYKASWPDERVIRCTLSTLAESGKGIESTALILVGEFLSGEFEESKLYSKSFSTGFREALT
jgi:precorrin-4/cobalt-precorrin-4 C11-methyltransferase